QGRTETFAHPGATMGSGVLGPSPWPQRVADSLASRPNYRIAPLHFTRTDLDGCPTAGGGRRSLPCTPVPSLGETAREVPERRSGHFAGAPLIWREVIQEAVNRRDGFAMRARLTS